MGLAALPEFCAAGQFGSEVKKAELTLSGNNYLLTAEFAYQLSDHAKEALKNGVPLFWTLQVKIWRQRDFFGDVTIIDRSIRYRIQYHALLNMYRVRNEITGQVENVSTLSSALEMISILHDFPVFNKNVLLPDIAYRAGVRVIFDREALPLPLRPIAYLSSQWYLSSDWYLWSLTK